MTSKAQSSDDGFLGTWSTTLQAPAQVHPLTPSFDDTLLVQTIRASAGGSRVRLQLSNAFGESELRIASASIALKPNADTPAPDATVQLMPLHFGGAETLTLAPGAETLSDPIDFELPPMADVVIRLRISKAPETPTTHFTWQAVSRSFHRPFSSAPDAPWQQVNHWYFISALYVANTAETPRSVVLLGDSITDGGVPPNSHQRWGDVLSRRLRAHPSTADIGVLNQGLSGNRLISDGNGLSALNRLDRDVLRHPGVRWLIVYIGVNDLGQGTTSRKAGHFGPSTAALIAGYEQIIDRAHAAGIKVYGATILPFKSAFYWSEEAEAQRQEINNWIRNSGRYDAVIDFDAALRDPFDPLYLAEPYDLGDFLHPSITGLEVMGRCIDLSLFEGPAD